MSTAVSSTRLGRRRRRAARASAALVAKRRVQVALATLLALLIALIGTGFVGAIVLYRSAENRYVNVALPLNRLTRDVLVRRGRVLAAALRGKPAPEMTAEARALVDWSTLTGAVRLGAGLDAALRRLESPSRSRM